jgi:hypothetical protein
MLTRDGILAVASALNAAGVGYLFVGGIAVIAHGYLRTTANLDIVLDLEPDNARCALQCLEYIGFRPRLPVPILDFADAVKRREWAVQKEMVVFSLWRDGDFGPLVVDLFVDNPFPFAEAWQAALWSEYKGGVRLPCVDLARLREMKRAAGRPKDLLDLDELGKIHGDQP